MDILLRIKCVVDGNDIYETHYYYSGGGETYTVEYIEQVSEGYTCTAYKRPTTEILEEYCQGTTKITAYHDGNGGVTKVEELQSYACGWQCVISIDELTTTHETKEGFSDGTVDVRITTNSTHTIYYSIDGFQTSQLTSKFENLAPGAYIYSVRDEDNTCSASQSFVIKPGDSGLPRYYLKPYYDAMGRYTENLIFKKGYTGISEALTGQGSPVIFHVSGRGLGLYTPIHTTEAQLAFHAFEDFQFNEFFLGDEREYRYEQYKDGVLSFKGYILQDIYSEAYLYPPFPVNISATDGLQLLHHYPVSQENGAGVLEDKTCLEWIVLILSKLEVNIPIVTQVNLYEATMPTGPEHDPLALSSISPRVFYNGNKPMDSFEALEAILNAFNARIVQVNGKWDITRISEADGGYFREYDYLGNLVASGTRTRVKTITKAP